MVGLRAQPSLCVQTVQMTPLLLTEVPVRMNAFASLDLEFPVAIPVLGAG